jgi:Leucine-rich repeat (LRR) protein
MVQYDIAWQNGRIVMKIILKYLKYKKAKMTNRLLFIINTLFLLFLVACQDPLYTGNSDKNLVADAGANQTTIVGSYAVFDPTNSTGDYNWYDWQQDESNPDHVKLFSGEKIKEEGNIQIVGFVKEGIYRFRLIVRSGVTPGNMSGTDFSEADEITITVNPNPFGRFEDPNLEITVRVALRIQVEELTESTLSTLDSLHSILTPQRISFLNGLDYCKNLYFLEMGLQDISDISPLASLTKLKRLGLDQNGKICDISPLAELTELEWLNLSDNMIMDISTLQNLSKLKYLNLRYNQNITEISSLNNLRELEELKMANASLTDLFPIVDLTKLKVLWFTNCGISDIGCLWKLSNVINLKISWSNVEDISSLSNMKKLEWVALEKNNISNISPLKDLPNLKYIRLWDNQITDIKSLVDNPGIDKGDIVGLDGNPLNDKSINEYIPALQARGVVVTW